MFKEFNRDCRNLVDEISKNTKLKSVDILLWIYLNIYYFSQITKENKQYVYEIFMAKLEASKYFIGNPLNYQSLECYQDLLRETILQKYSYIKSVKENKIQLVELKDMEELYEGLLMEGIRSKTGTYYTPQSIVYYIVVNTLLAYLKNKIQDDKNELESFILQHKETLHKETASKLLTILDNIKIIDLACGGGVFLRETLKVLFQLNKKLLHLLSLYMKDQQILELLLKNSIYGIDIQHSTVLLCRLLLLMEFNKLGGSNNVDAIELNVLWDNALTMDKISTRCGENSFDIVLGNPPYIGERGNRSIFNEIKDSYFGQKYYEGKMDYFYFFIYKGGEILKKEGTLGFITTNYFVTADGAVKLRTFLRENFSFREIINFNESNVFKDATGQHNMIFIANKSQEKQGPRVLSIINKKLNGGDVVSKLLEKVELEGVHSSILSKQEDLYDGKGQILIQSHMGGGALLNKIAKVSNFTLRDFCNVNQGIVSGADRLTATWADKLDIEVDKGTGIFVLTEKEVEEKGLSEVPYSYYLKDFYKNSHIKKYYLLKNQGLKILYLDDEEPQDISNLPVIHQHLLKYRSILQQRREVKQGSRNWYALQWPRRKEIFEGEKIVVPQRSLENSFAYDNGDWYASADVYYITLKSNNISLLTILAILNSSLIYFWLFYRGKRKGEYLELYGTPLKNIPLPTIIELIGLNEIDTLVKQITENLLEKKDVSYLQQQLDEIVYSLYKLKEEEKNVINGFVNERRKSK